MTFTATVKVRAYLGLNVPEAHYTAVTTDYTVYVTIE